jgi:transcriptional regulator with XRE-family HTH domain
MLTETAVSINYMFMTKASSALDRLSPATVAAIEKLGADLAVARLRRGESLKTWAKRMGVSVPTLQRLEAGDPGVSIGILATALWLLNRDGQLTQMAAPEHDQGAIELSVQDAQQLGRARAQASAEARLGVGKRSS